LFCFGSRLKTPQIMVLSESPQQDGVVCTVVVSQFVN
jgi:hypothetical protein